MVSAEGELVRAASLLRAGADELLRSTELLSLLEQHGTVYLTGSYAYDLMTWRDIDLCVATYDLSVGAMFRVGATLAELPNVGSMYYRNEFVLKTSGNPLAFFWCVDFVLPDNEKWKVDVLLAGPEEIGRVLQPGEKLREGLTPKVRETILRIKGVVGKRAAYRQEYGSRAIYQAVVEHNVRTVAEWDVWWAEQRA